MLSDRAVEQELEVHRALRAALAGSWNAFFARFGRLRPVQLAAIPSILAGKDVLVTAPTAGGKTEAVAAPICERLARERWQNLSCILVTPTRALVNDLYDRLDRPVTEMGIRLGRKTSDHAVSPGFTEQFLITTPESLESLLTFRRERLVDLRTLILDEIHLLDGTPRGDQLRTVIQRLRLFLASHAEPTHPLQMLALSATLPSARETASRYLGPHSEVISVPGQRSIKAAIIVADGDDSCRAQAAVQSAEQFDDIRKMLVFYNSRNAVDVAGQYFQTGRFANAALHCHHGSLAKAERERSEQRFKEDRFAVCVSTMTLEIGIDIGDVDLVVCMSPPSSISSFLQRLGRGCRRLQGATRALCIARNRAEELIFEAMIAGATRPISAGPRIPFRRSVLVQQILAYLQQVDSHRRTMEQFKRALTTLPSPRVDEGMLAAVLHEMCENGMLVVRNGVYEPASQGWQFIQSDRIFSNIAPASAAVRIVDADTGRLVATAASLSSDGDRRLRVAGRAFEVVGAHGSQVTVRGVDHSTTPPRYDSKRFPYAYDVGAAMGESFSIAPGTILVLAVNDYLFVMTWLGKLLNSLLASIASKDGVLAVAACFSIRLPVDQRPMLLSRLQGWFQQAASPENLETLAIERFVDLGPNHWELSAEGQRATSRDWADPEFLEHWIHSIRDVEVVNESDSRAADLLALAVVS